MRQSENWIYRALPDHYHYGEVLIFYTLGLATTGPVREQPPEAKQLKQRLDYNRGICEQYFSTGALMATGPHLNGIKHGAWQQYFMDGSLRSVGHFDHGQKQDYWHTYSVNGGLAHEGAYEQGTQTGAWTEYHETGEVKSFGLYEDGIKNGRWYYYKNDGAIAAEGAYLNGVKSGPWFEYPENEQEQTAFGTYIDGKRQGVWLVDGKEFYYNAGQRYASQTKALSPGTKNNAGDTQEKGFSLNRTSLFREKDPAMRRLTQHLCLN